MAVTRRLPVLLIAMGLLSLCGCSERPFGGMADPWSRRSWVEDERFGPTYHTKRQELRKLRRGVGSRSPEEQERTAVELAERLQQEQHPVLRSEIIRALAEISSPIASEALKHAMNDADPDVRVVACQAWGRRGTEEARQVLAQCLGSDTDVDVRIAAARELGAFKDDRQAMQALKLALDESSPALQYRAVQSLREMSGRDYGNDLVAWREFIDGGNPPEQPPPSLADRLRNLY